MGYTELALNGVGGAQAKSIAKTLKPHHTMVTYGAMAREPLTIGNALLIYQNIGLKGFNRSRYLDEHRKTHVKDLYNTMFKQMTNINKEDFPIIKSYPLSDFQEAITHAKREGLNGKILLTA